MRMWMAIPGPGPPCFHKGSLGHHVNSRQPRPRVRTACHTANAPSTKAGPTCLEQPHVRAQGGDEGVRRVVDQAHSCCRVGLAASRVDPRPPPAAHRLGALRAQHARHHRDVHGALGGRRVAGRRAGGWDRAIVLPLALSMPAGPVWSGGALLAPKPQHSHEHHTHTETLQRSSCLTAPSPV